jgi:hypothetical protein
MGRIDSRWIQAVLVAALVASAGCSMVPGMSTPTPTATSQSTPTPTATPTPTVTSTPTPISYPPGLSDSGYKDRDELVDGHVDRLAGTSFTSVTRLEFDDGTVTIRVKGDPERGHVTKVRSEGGEATGKFYYADGNADVARGFDGGSMTYREALTFDGQFENLYWATLTDPEREEGEERTVFTYDITDENNGSLAVTGDGLILSYTLEQPDGPDIHYEVSGIGITTVEEPRWAAIERAHSTGPRHAVR